MLVKIIMKIFKKFFKNDQKLNAKEVAFLSDDKGETLDKYLDSLKKFGIKRLWFGNVTENNQTIELEDNYTNYDAIIVCLRLNTGNQGFYRMSTQFIPIDLINLADNSLTMYMFDSVVLTYTLLSNNKITTNENFSNYFALKAVYGLKISKN